MDRFLRWRWWSWLGLGSWSGFAEALSGQFCFSRFVMLLFWLNQRRSFILTGIRSVACQMSDRRGQMVAIFLGLAIVVILVTFEVD